MCVEDITKAAATLGRLGGLAKSRKKAKAVRENGKKGGRPKNRYTVHLQSGNMFAVHDLNIRTHVGLYGTRSEAEEACSYLNQRDPRQ